MLFISAGHEPKFPGACYEGFCEHEEAVRWVSEIVRHLKGRVPLTEVPSAPLDNPKSPSTNLIEKVIIVNKNCKPNDLVVEIHFNSDESKKQKGSETLYCPGSSKGFDIAKQLQSAIGSFLSPNRGWKEGWYLQDRPNHLDYPGDVEGDERIDYILKATNCPAIILEPEFIYNRAKIEDYRAIVCEVLADNFVDLYSRGYC